MRPRKLPAWAACALLAGSVGCATTGARARAGSARGVANDFPSRAELATLASSASARPVSDRRTAPIERWELSGPLPTAMGSAPATDATPYATLLRERAGATGGRVVVTQALQCAARELGRYALGHEGTAPQPLVDFVASRCGALNEALSVNVSRGTGDPSAPESALVSHFRADLVAAADRLFGEGPVNVGGWVGREGERFVVLSVAERRRVIIEPRPFTPDAQGVVVIDGRLLEAAANVSAQVNRGRWSTQPCERDASVRLPLFRVRCPVAAEDAAARLEVTAFPPQRLLGHVVFNALVGAGRDASRTFEVSPPDPARVAHDPAQSRDVLLSLLNDARRAASLAPVTLAARETDTACQVAPAFFSSVEDPAGATATDRIALGMMAGWDVEGAMIREGRFFTGAGAREDDLARWLAWNLERPMGRSVLLDGAVRQVALCPWMIDGHVQGVLWSSYSFYDDASVADEERGVYARIDEARRATGKGAVTRLTDLRPMMESHARSLQNNAGGLDATLQAMMRDAVAARGRGVRGWVIPTSDLASIEFPDDVVSPASLRIGVHVAHWRQPDAAWGQSVVFLLVEAG